MVLLFAVIYLFVCVILIQEFLWSEVLCVLFQTTSFLFTVETWVFEGFGDFLILSFGPFGRHLGFLQLPLGFSI